MGLCFKNWYLPRDPYFEKNSIYLLCSNEKKQHLPPLLPKLVFTSGPLLLKKQHLPPLLKRKKTAFTSFASKIGIYLGTSTFKKTAFTSFAQTKKNSIYLLGFQNWYLPRDPYFKKNSI